MRRVDRCWLGRPDRVSAVDAYVRGRLAEHRGLPRGHAEPGVRSVELLVADIRGFGVNEQWFWAIVAMCFLAELITNAAPGGTSIKKAATGVDQRKGGWKVLRDREVAARYSLIEVLEPVGYVRNAVAHPAATASDSAFVDEFVRWCERNGKPELADHLAPPLAGKSREAREVILAPNSRVPWRRVDTEHVALFVLGQLGAISTFLDQLPP